MIDHEIAERLATRAGDLLLDVRAEYAAADAAERKAAGDKRSHEFLMTELARLRPDDAVLSEEATEEERANNARLTSDRVWIIDPLDGTREFSTRGRDDWAVHIALWQRCANGRPQITDAAVSLPARGNIVYRSDTVTANAAPVGIPGVIRIAASATRPPAILYRIRQILDIELVRIGSAGAKAMAIIDGVADAYVHAGGQWEWDSAAPAGVVSAAGMHVSRLDGSPMMYNQLDPYLPDFVMCRAELAPVLLEAIRECWW